MKLVLALCALSIAVVGLGAAPQRFGWVELLASKIGAPCQNIWKNCTTPSDKADIITVGITPCPPEAGKDLTIVATFNLKEQVTGGKVHVDLKIDSIIPIKKDLDLCETAKTAGLTCPVAAGMHTLNYTQSLPSISGHVKGSVKVDDKNGKELACITVDTKG